MSYLQNPKIDNEAVDGLLGVKDSLAYKVHEIEKHFHGREIWYSRDPTDGYLLLGGLGSWTVTAGTSENFGTGLQISDGTEIESGDSSKYYDFHRILFTSSSRSDNTYLLAIRYGTSTYALSEQLSLIPYRTGTSVTEVLPATISSPRITCNNKVWVALKSQNDSETLDFIFGIHTYPA